jgi:hypothetical protein
MGGRNLEAVISALWTIRARRVGGEIAYLQPLVAEALDGARIAYRREIKLGPGCRVDFLTDGGVDIEVKRGRPRKDILLRQLERYASHDAVSAVVLVLERAVQLPDTMSGKPVRVVSLRMLWGLAV